MTGMTSGPDPVVFGPPPPDPFAELGAGLVAARDPLAALAAELRTLLAAVFGPPRGLMQVIPPDPDALARLAARTPQPDPEAAARYIAGRYGGPARD